MEESPHSEIELQEGAGVIAEVIAVDKSESDDDFEQRLFCTPTSTST